MFSKPSPVWRTWESVVKVAYNPSVLTENDVRKIFDSAGKDVGIGIGRPYYGTFSIVSHEM
jgi:hypothetical protein